MHNKPDGERLARIEALMETAQIGLTKQSERAEVILHTMLDKMDMLDAKIEARFQSIEHDASNDARELQALKNKGAGVLAALGVVFTMTATIFSEFFVHIKDVLFG